MPGYADYAGVGLHGSQRLRWKKGVIKTKDADQRGREDANDWDPFRFQVEPAEFCALDVKPLTQDAINHGYSSA